jgi:TRAP-type uncharacterized transport system substrate-binding protein
MLAQLKTLLPNNTTVTPSINDSYKIDFDSLITIDKHLKTLQQKLPDYTVRHVPSTLYVVVEPKIKQETINLPFELTTAHGHLDTETLRKIQKHLYDTSTNKADLHKNVLHYFKHIPNLRESFEHFIITKQPANKHTPERLVDHFIWDISKLETNKKKKKFE